MKTSVGLAVLSVLASYATAAPADAEVLEERSIFGDIKGKLTGPDDNYKAASKTKPESFSSATDDQILCVKWKFPTKNGAPQGMTDDDQVADAGGMHTDLVCGNVLNKNTKYKAKVFSLDQTGVIHKDKLEDKMSDFDYKGAGKGQMSWLGEVTGQYNGKQINDVDTIGDAADDLVKDKKAGSLTSDAFVTELWQSVSGNNGTAGEQKHHWYDIGHHDKDKEGKGSV